MEEEIPVPKYYNEAAKKSIYKYRLKNPDCQVKPSKKWRESNPKKIKEYMKNYYANNKEKILLRLREQYRLKNLEKNAKKIINLINPEISLNLGII